MTMKNVTRHTLAATLAIVFLAPTSFASPKKTVEAPWGKIGTNCFEARLPLGWELIRRKKKHDDDWVGAWAWESQRGQRKIWIRCMKLAQGTPIRTLMQKGEAYLKRKFKPLKLVTESVSKDRKGRPQSLSIYEGSLKTIDPKSKKQSTTKFVIVRAVQFYPGRGLALIATYAFAGPRAADVQKFVERHSDTLDPITKDEMIKLRLKKAKNPKGKIVHKPSK
jgi:hypothetical protein